VTEESVFSSFGFVDLSQWENPETVSDAQESNTGIVVEFSRATGSVRNFTSGHRNVSSLVMRNGDIFSLEHSMKGGDEINFLKEGSNFGYPFVTYGTKYSSYSKPEPAADAPEGVKLEEPFWSFVPSIAPGDGYYLANSVFERWNDSIIVAGLKSRSIFVGKMAGDSLVYMEPIFIGERVRSVTYFKDALYLLTDSAKVLELKIDRKSYENDTGGTGLVARSPHLKKCVVCHLLEPSEVETAPHLFGIIGRPIASLAYDYTPEFSDLQGQVWTKDLLIQFIREPESLVKGSSMPSVGVNAIEAYNIYEELRKLK
jgi:cytochrome c2